MNTMEHPTTEYHTEYRTGEHTGEHTPGRHSSGFAITSFVLGIASIVAGWTLIAPIVGLVFGILALRRQTSERTLARWGVWINVAMLVFGALLLALGLGVAALGLLGGSLLDVFG